VPPARLSSILREAGAFYCAQMPGTWVPGYLESRRISPGIARDWGLGYAPPGWAALTDHLRAGGYADEEIEAAGLARRSSRGTLIDLFRDRVMLPVRNADGQVVGFTGRARPGAGPATPKYLNSPQTALYKKGDLLFGLHEARPALTAGAMPVIVEGPFDAIAVTIAGAGQLAGLAPCGTALTTRQAALLARACDLARSGVLAAFDDDPAGRKAAIRGYAILRPHTPDLRSATLAGHDPAEILQAGGPKALRDALTITTVPLLSVIIDADLDRWEQRLSDVEGPLRAMRSAAALLAGLLPPEAAGRVKAAAGGTELAMVDDDLRPATPLQAPAIARALPADTAFQVTRLADRLGLTITETAIEVANAVTRQSTAQGTPKQPTAARLAAGSFPRDPVVAPDTEATVQPRRSASPGRGQASHRRQLRALLLRATGVRPSRAPNRREKLCQLALGTALAQITRFCRSVPCLIVRAAGLSGPSDSRDAGILDRSFTRVAGQQWWAVARQVWSSARTCSVSRTISSMAPRSSHRRTRWRLAWSLFLAHAAYWGELPRGTVVCEGFSRVLALLPVLLRAMPRGMVVCEGFSRAAHARSDRTLSAPGMQSIGLARRVHRNAFRACREPRDWSAATTSSASYGSIRFAISFNAAADVRLSW
jgi:DNA primase